MKITIKEKEYTLKYTIRAMFLFEQIKGSMFQIASLTDEFIFFYSMILASDPSTDLSFDDFIDEVDSKPELMKKYKEFMEKEMKKQNQFMLEEDNKDDDKKKE